MIKAGRTHRHADEMQMFFCAASKGKNITSRLAARSLHRSSGQQVHYMHMHEPIRPVHIPFSRLARCQLYWLEMEIQAKWRVKAWLWHWIFYFGILISFPFFSILPMLLFFRISQFKLYKHFSFIKWILFCNSMEKNLKKRLYCVKKKVIFFYYCLGFKYKF